MKKLMLLGVVAGLIASSLAVPASAGKAKPVSTTLYFHGNSPIGEPDGLDGALNGVYASMDTSEPSDAQPKSMSVVSYVAGPNTTCAGSFLAPVWVGKVAGKIVGDVKVTFDAISTPTGKVDVQLYPDQVAFACDMESPAQVRVDLPPGPGKVEAVIKKVNLPVTGALMVQITPVIDGPFYSRVLYDSTSFASKIEFKCVPAKGQNTCA